MASVDSGVETGNDSNDSSIVQHENQFATVIASSVATVANVNTATTDQIAEIKPDAVSDTCKSNDSVLPNFFVSLQHSSDNICSLMTRGIDTSSFHRRHRLCPHDIEQNWSRNQMFRAYPGSMGLCKMHYRRSFGRKIRLDNTCCFPMQDRYSFHSIKVSDPHWIEWRKMHYERKLRQAAAANDIHTVERLLEYKYISPNNCDMQGRTPLHHAACRGYTDVVRLLLEHGADPNQRDRIGNTPLHLAAVTSKISVVTLLLASGTDVSLIDYQGFNPLHLAQAKLKILQSYKETGSMVNIKEEMHSIVEMLMTYLTKQKNMNDQIETLNNFCSRLSLSSTSDEVQDDVKDLLANLETLDITS